MSDEELRTKTGRVLTEADIEALADEAERGYPVHKATPQAENLGVSTCIHCGDGIRRVPGGQGPTWVHNSTGAVAAPGGGN